MPQQYPQIQQEKLTNLDVSYTFFFYRIISFNQLAYTTIQSQADHILKQIPSE